MKLRNKQNTIKRIIRTNILKKHWVLGRDLISIVNFNLGIKLDAIELRNYIKELRLAGNLIIASKQGYKIAYTDKELAKYCLARMRELHQEQKVLNAMIKAGRKVWTSQ